MLYYFKDKYKLLEGKLEVKDVATSLIVTKWNFTRQAMLTWPGGGGGCTAPVLRVKGHKKTGPRSGLARGAAKFSLEIYQLFLGLLYSLFEF
jgi:hypothetical protein